MRERLLVPPGMTGLWQVSGGNKLSFKDMVRLDIEYIKQQSMFLDAKILWKTAGLVLRRDGNYWKENSEDGDLSGYRVSESSN
jgi:lipopolysaccharide/colanic/teichoic acid biosynthesis glycosyltransferase